METLIIKYDSKNKAAQKLVDFLRASKIIKVQKPKTPNETTVKAIKAAENKSRKLYKNVDDLMNDLNK